MTCLRARLSSHKRIKLMGSKMSLNEETKYLRNYLQRLYKDCVTYFIFAELNI